jgi:hypothetical protein
MEESRPKRRVAKRTFAKRKRQRKSWLQRRTGHYTSIQTIVEESLKDECIGVGSETSDKLLRIGRRLGSGAFGSVYDMHLHAEDVVIHLAVKIVLNDDTTLEEEEVEADEQGIAEMVSRAVLKGTSEHFLLYYGYGRCNMSYYPEDMPGIGRALQIQQWMNTILTYVEGPPRLLKALRESDLETILFDEGLQRVKEVLKANSENNFKYRLRRGLRMDPKATVEMAPLPETIPVRMMIMEKASMTIEEYLDGASSREAHNVVRQIISASADFVRITSMIHMDLAHLKNVMVIQNDDGKTRLVLIDFGRVLPLDELSPFQGVLDMVGDSTHGIRGYLLREKIQPKLLKTVESFHSGSSASTIDELYIFWDILAEQNVKEEEEEEASSITEGIQEKLGSLLF